jgi:molybdopterin converting factor small subunit
VTGTEERETATVEVRLFATFREYLPLGSDTFSCRMDLAGGATAADIIAGLGLPDQIPKIILVNGTHATEQHVLHDGDVISIFPPIAGG